MAQVTEIQQQTTNRQCLSSKNTSIAVPQAGNTTLLVVPCSRLSRIFVSIVVAGFALDALTISGRPSLDANNVVLYNAAGDFTSPSGLMIDASGDLTTQAVGTGWFAMDVLGLSEITISASSVNAAGSTVSAYCSGA